MNAAVLMLTACLAGADPVPAPAAPAAPAPVVVQGGGNNCCGHATVDCCDANKCCLLHKIKEKICCFNLCCDKGHGCDQGPACHKPCAPACNPCPKPVCNPCPKPVCNPCPPKPCCAPACPPKPCCPQQCAPVCQKQCAPACPQQCAPACPKTCSFSCEKPACCKVEPVCHDCCTSICWKPGYCLHKCKEHLCGLCDKGTTCHGGCGTACTPCSSGSSAVVAPGGPAPAPVAPKAMPDVKKVGSTYNGRSDISPASGTGPRVIELTPAPF